MIAYLLPLFPFLHVFVVIMHPVAFWHIDSLNKKVLFYTFGNFCDLNMPTVADFNLAI
jgi:hypothetical protein